MAAPVHMDAREKANLTKSLLSEKMDQRRREMEEKRRRMEVFQARLADPTLTEDQKTALTEEFKLNERRIMIDMRKRYSIEDFEPLAVIGRGAFGEVRLT
jgi:serine/threonine kinase 38